MPVRCVRFGCNGNRPDRMTHHHRFFSSFSSGYTANAIIHNVFDTNKSAQQQQHWHKEKKHTHTKIGCKKRKKITSSNSTIVLEFKSITLVLCSTNSMNFLENLYSPDSHLECLCMKMEDINVLVF